MHAAVPLAQHDTGMPFNFKQFLSAALDLPLQNQLNQQPDFPKDLRHCLVTGPEHRQGACSMPQVLAVIAFVAFERLHRHSGVSGLTAFFRCHSGRTALLFHYAYSRAAAGEDVLFVTRRKAVEFEPPVLPAGVSKDDAALERIKLR